ncbi:MAG: serine/threonine protein kinase [Myxococcaceae bacterium]|nr:serine/threonine protein kinase [Myxococcaceae bacterium]
MGPWRVERPAGRGTYGVVYRARNAGHPTSKPVALKLAVFPGDPRFVREVTALSRIHHPAVPEFIDRGWWRPEGGLLHPYVVMQWVDGLPLYEWAELGVVTSRQVLRVLAQLARALEATHEQECLHRDVKGDNVRVTPDVQAFLMDYGSSTWAGASLLTEEPMPPGTRDYRSPEALRFHWSSRRQKGAHYEASPADDIYALGVSMYRVATGVHPPPGTDPEARKDPLRPPLPLRLLPQSLNGRVVPELASLIEWMLAQAPQKRPGARELAKAAEAAMKRVNPEADLPLSGSNPVIARAPSVQVSANFVPHKYEHRRWPMLASAASLLLGLSAPWFMSRQPAHPSPVEVNWVLEEVSDAEKPDAGGSEDGGKADLGDTAMTAHAVPRDVPVSPEAITQNMPEKPLDGQRRAPCAPGQVNINGGCWKRPANSVPPCGEDEYEWKNTCYLPILKRGRSSTSRMEP